MKLFHKYILVVVFELVCVRFTSAQIITEFTKIQPAGIVDITANNLSDSEPVNWIITSYYIDEDDNTFENSKDTLFSVGDTVRALFIKKVGKYTFYKIFVGNSSFADSVEFQVLDKGIPERYLFQNKSLPNKPIVVFVVLPDDIANANFVMIMHGVDRNSLDYIQAWKTFGKNNNCVCAAPTFTDKDWPSSSSYNLGNMFNSLNIINPDSIWSFSLISKIHDELVDALGMKNQQYDIWGHSAGAQFVHRLMTFKPDYKIRYAMAANAGWYTLPDYNIDYPFGLRNEYLEYDETFLEDLIIKKMIIFRGVLDTARDSNLNTSAEADQQGLNRFERAETYYNYAEEIETNNSWKLIDVENSGHDYTLMAKATQTFLQNPTKIEELDPAINNEITLYQNYPNPFNPSTYIRFNIPANIGNGGNKVTLKIYNTLGEEVAVLLNNSELTGMNNILFEAKDKFNNPLSSGIYIISLTAGDYRASNKMILLK